MKNYLKILMAVGLLAVMMPWLLAYIAGPAGANHPTPVKDHQFSGNISSSACSVCHDALTHEKGTVAQPGVHKTHLMSTWLKFECSDCHEETVYDDSAYWGTAIGNSGAEEDGGNSAKNAFGSGLEGDLSYNDTDAPNTTSIANFKRGARKQVKPGVCNSCHGKYNSASPSHVGTTINTGCVSTGGAGCHAVPATLTTQHTASYVQNYANPTFCKLCHGANAWYQTTETVDVLP